MKNHRDFQENLSNHIKKAEKNNNNISVVIFDINSLAQINREYGHAKGDEIICLVAN